MSNRRDCPPVILQNGNLKRPERIPFDKRLFDEGWLQELIRLNPDILPAGEIEPAFSPLVSIGREVPTSVGPIDNLFVSPEGYLCIVETKLWRNPEARREVVGQIIDYAKEISRWSFEDLESYVRAYNRHYHQTDRGIIDTLRQVEQIEEEDEAGIVDAICRNLQRGRFLLLVVGDGIRESVEAMVEYLNQTPQLFFTLALIELQIYRLEQENLLIVPQVVMRTQEVTRAIIRFEGQTPSGVTVNMKEEASKSTSKRSVLTEEDYFAILSQNVDESSVAFARQILQDMENRGYYIDWLKGSFVIKLPDPNGSGKNITLFVVNTDGKVYIGWMERQLLTLGLSQGIAGEFAQTSANAIGRRVMDGYLDSWDRFVALRELEPYYDGFVKVVDATVERIRKAAME